MKHSENQWGLFTSLRSKTNLGGLDLSRRFSKVDLDMMDNLDAFQKLVSTIEISRSRLRYLDLVSMSLAKTVLLVEIEIFETNRDFCDFCGLLDFCLNLDREITWFFTYLDRDIYFNCRNLWKVVGEAQGKQRKVKVKPSPATFHRCLKSKISWSRLKKSRFILKKSWLISKKSRLPSNILKILICLKSLDLSRRSR